MLFSLFSSLVEIFSFLNVFKYLTVRTGLSMFTSMTVVFLVGGPLINYFSSHQIHDPIREDGPSEHIVKKIGTPTMGGLMILLGIFSGVLLWGDLSNPYNWFLIYIAGSFGLLGAYDDFQKIKKNKLKGMDIANIIRTLTIRSCLGFLWFNAPPAKIFMGDTGSLALGGSLGAVGIITKHEIVLAITGGLFVLEAVSVIAQVISFKLTGRRIFKMAPIHHHFEKKGWPESTVVIRFWIISIILAMIGLATLKLR